MAGLPAARAGDAHNCVFPIPIPHVGGPIEPPCASKVLIHGLPAARAGDVALCAAPRLKDPLMPGAPKVLIMGKPAVRKGAKTSHPTGVVTGGDGKVLIG